MTEHFDERGNWIRDRIYELQNAGLSYDDARTQAETEAADKFGEENGHNGDGETG
jgi:hypothetical protein